MFFFLLWPLFARAPRHWFLENFLLSAPGVQSVFFCFVALRWAPRPFGGARAKKKTPPRVFFFLLRPRGKAGQGEAPCRHGARAKKKNTTQGVFFCCGPGERQGKEKPRWAPARGQSKKKTPPRVFFFAPAPGKGRGRRSPVGRRHAAPPGCSLTHCGLGRFRQGPGGVFFLLRPRRVFLDNSKKCLGYYIGSKKTRRGHSKKKNTTSP